MISGLIPLLLVMLAPAAPQTRAAGAKPHQRTNIFALASGAVLLSRPPGAWEPLFVMDDNPATGWSSVDQQTSGNTFVFELSRRFRLASIALDNASTQESSYPGISARNVEVWTSTTSPSEGFTRAATLEAVKGARKEFPLRPVEARWVKLVVSSNWGNPHWTELMEIEGYGEPVGPVPARPPISGVFQTNYGPLLLKQDGISISGCYYGGDGILQGATDGRMVSFEWRQGPKKERVGTAVMVLTAAGGFLDGLWYEGGAVKGTWAGERTPNAANPCVPPGGGTLAANLQQSGRAILYGIHFASDSAVITADSDQTLQQVLGLLQSHPATRLRIEGYTDSTNTDEYNLDLSKRRAQAVVSWLTGHGIAVNRLTAQGFGKNSSVADNVTAQGRALNRRVEIAVVP